jgi:DNA repair exonuclease SbcCD ATPase subunit
MYNSGVKFAHVRQKYEKLAAEKSILASQIAVARGAIEGLKKQRDTIIQAVALVKNVTREAQEQFKNEVDGAVTMAVKTMFDEDFFFDLEIKSGGRGLECKPKIWERFEGVDVEYTPKDEMGGSIIDPIGLALRVILQVLDPNPTRPTFLLDEPMKNVGKGDLLERAGQLIRDISHRMKRQLIIITHEPELAEIADRAWRVVRRRGKSAATVIKDTAKHKRRLIK